MDDATREQVKRAAREIRDLASHISGDLKDAIGGQVEGAKYRAVKIHKKADEIERAVDLWD